MRALPPHLWGGPCAAGPSVKLGPWRRSGLNWPCNATSSRQTKTAAEGKPAQPFLGRAAGGRGRGDEHWGRLGDARRAAIRCPKGDSDAPPYRGLCLKVFLENVYGYLDI